MAALIENFGSWAYANRAQEGWTHILGTNAVSPTIVAGPRAGSSALRVDIGQVNASGYSVTVSKALPFSSTAVRCHARIRITLRPVSGQRALIQLRESGTVHLSLCFNAAGFLELRRGEAAGTLLGTSSVSLTNDVGYSVEFRAVISDTVGVFELRIGPTAAINLTGADTRNAGVSGAINTFVLGDPVSLVGPNGVFDVSDLVVWDETGASLGNNWIGDVRVSPAAMTADTGTKNFSRSSGADNYALIDDAVADTADYVFASADATTDLYTVENLPFTPTTIYAVAWHGLCGKDDAGPMTLLPRITSGGTAHVGPDQALITGGYGRVQYVLEHDPNTAARFTQAGFNALLIGQETNT